MSSPDTKVTKENICPVEFLGSVAQTSVPEQPVEAQPPWAKVTLTREASPLRESAQSNAAPLPHSKTRPDRLRQCSAPAATEPAAVEGRPARHETSTQYG